MKIYQEIRREVQNIGLLFLYIKCVHEIKKKIKAYRKAFKKFCTMQSQMTMPDKSLFALALLILLKINIGLSSCQQLFILKK